MGIGTLVGALVQDTTTTTGTGAITLAGAVPAGAPAGSTTFAQQFGTSAQTAPGNTFYAIIDGSGNIEVGLGTFNGTTTLTRDYVLGSYTGGTISLASQTPDGTHVNFAAGTKNVYSNANIFAQSVATWARIPDDNAANIFNATMSGTFTITVTQGAVNTNGTCRYKITNEGMCTLSFPAAITANGAATTCSLSGIPAFLGSVGVSQVSSVNSVQVNAATIIGALQIVAGATPTTTATANLLSGSTLTTTTTTGTASGVSAGSSFTYPLF
jgi:hypothetical protein